MPAEAKKWVKPTHRTNNGNRGGIFVYIDSVALGRSLDSVGISRNADLEVCRHSTKGRNKVARVVLEIREIKNE